MSEQLKNQKDHNKGAYSGNRNGNKDSHRSEGFDGMNYEQVRPPYKNQDHDKDRNGTQNGGSNSEGNEHF